MPDCVTWESAISERIRVKPPNTAARLIYHDYHFQLSLSEWDTVWGNVTWSAISERSLWPTYVKVAPPVVDDQPRIGRGAKVALVQALISEAPAEGFDVNNLDWLGEIDNV